MQINAIAAVGVRGQLGLNGRMPWAKDAEDLEFFRAQTLGKVVVFGGVTFDKLFADQPVWGNRMVLRMGYEKTSIYDSGELKGFWNGGIDPIVDTLEGKVQEIWIAGGHQMYDLWCERIRRWYITKVEYDGNCDVWMPVPWMG